MTQTHAHMWGSIAMCSDTHQKNGRGVQARSWRANWDVEVRRQFLGFCLGLYPTSEPSNRTQETGSWVRSELKA